MPTSFAWLTRSGQAVRNLAGKTYSVQDFSACSFDNTNISFARVAERPKCLLIGGAVVSGHGQFGAIELGQRDPLSNPLFVGFRGVAARKEAAAIGDNGRSGKFSVRCQCRRIGNRTIEGDPISFCHLDTPKARTKHSNFRPFRRLWQPPAGTTRLLNPARIEKTGCSSIFWFACSLVCPFDSE